MVHIVGPHGDHPTLVFDDLVRPSPTGVKVLLLTGHVVGHRQCPDRMGILEERHVMGGWISVVSVGETGDLLVQLRRGEIAECYEPDLEFVVAIILRIDFATF